jgi:hypothetical protein
MDSYSAHYATGGRERVAVHPGAGAPPPEAAVSRLLRLASFLNPTTCVVAGIGALARRTPGLRPASAGRLDP